MTPQIFKASPGKAIFWMLVSLLMLFFTLPMATTLPVLMLANGLSTEGVVLTLVCGALGWLNLAWFCRNFGLATAAKPPEIVVSADGIFLRTVRRSYRVPDLLRPKNIWQERIIGWAEYQRHESVMVEYDSESAVIGLRLVVAGGPPLEIREAVFGGQVQAIATAIERAKG